MLEGLGVPLDISPGGGPALLRVQQFRLSLQPALPPCFRNTAPLRRELGIRTLFNLLGPLINPARPSHILLGVARPDLLRLMAETLAQSPVRRAAVVCGAGSYDEITPLGVNEMILLRDGELTPFTLDPADFGIPPCAPEDLAVSSREEAVNVLRELLNGGGPSAMRDMLALNVGMGIHLHEDQLSPGCLLGPVRGRLWPPGAGGKVAS